MNFVKKIYQLILKSLNYKKVKLVIFSILILIIIGFGVFALYYAVSGYNKTKSNYGATSNQQTTNGTAAQSGNPSNSSSANQSSNLWLIASSAVGYINQAEGSSNFTNSIFNFSYDYEITTPHISGGNLLSHATKVMSYKSYAQFQADAYSHSLPSGYPVMMYDNEDWSYTPINEQQNPILYYRQFGQLAHSLGYHVLATPAADLTKVLLPKTDNYSGYLKLGLAKTAQFADIFNIQAQNTTNAQSYISFVVSAIAQIKQVNPKAIILAGLTVKINGPSLATLEKEYNGTKNLVNGYWLNVISHTPSDNIYVGNLAHEFLIAVKA